jgi:hypothetical protein
MPSYVFTGAFNLTANSSTTSPSPGPSPSSLSISRTHSFSGNNDSENGTVNLSASQTQTVYQPDDITTNLPKVAYLYMQASAANSSSVSVVYQTGSASTTIGNLKPGEWMYMPVSVSPTSATSSSVKLTNDSATDSASVFALWAESGSTPI